MLDKYITIKKDGLHETEIKRSRFITRLARVEDEEEAKEIIDEIKKEHWKATHNCTAFVIGPRNEIQRSNDDGEPSGTAGIPMLEILKVREVINTVAVVTRYFGGTKLGAGGLIRAYGGAVNDAIDAIGLVEGRLQQEVIIELDYPNHGRLEHFLETQNYTIKDSLFTDKVKVICMIDEKEIPTFEEQIINLLSNECQIALGKKDYFEQPIE